MEMDAAKLIGAGLAVIALAGVGVGIGNIFANACYCCRKKSSCQKRSFWNSYSWFCFN